MTPLAEDKQKQILLLAPELIGKSLVLKLKTDQQNRKIVLSKNDLSQHPQLVIWYLDNSEITTAIQLELIRLKERWFPSPILFIIPPNINLIPSELLKLDCSGLLQDPNLENLKEDIETLLDGGRVVRIQGDLSQNKSTPKMVMGLGQWLLISGLQQINDELKNVDSILIHKPNNPIILLILTGRKRELNCARSLLKLIWGPPKVLIKPIQLDLSPINNNKRNYQTQIKLNNKSSEAIWQAIYIRLKHSVQGRLTNSTGQVLAIDALKNIYQKELLTSLIEELDKSLKRITTNNNKTQGIVLDWNELQLEIRQNAIRLLIGNYVRMPKSGEIKSVSDQLVNMADLSDQDEELPSSQLILEPLILNKPVLIEGQPLSIDNPRAILRLETLISNWVVRTAEIIGAELISISSEWPELRTHLLNPKLISTRELERFRNQLNSQNQWQNLIKRPIRLYESKRLLYTIKDGEMSSLILTEARDEELKRLSWLQQQVALLVETRDALAPQIQTLIKYIGDLMVVVLTKVIGRAIGLVGKGIAQGMGRTFSKG